MKKLSCTLALLLLLPALFLPASANSSPTRWEGAPGSEVLVVDEDCPVTVEHETLTFRVGEREHYILPAQVTAVYEMKNPSAEALTVQMAFYPVVPNGPRPSGPISATITADGTPVPYEAQIDPTTSTTALVYSVAFAAGESRTVSVSYATASDMNQRKTPTPLYTFSYLLQPASHWAAFGSLDIRVETPADAPYVVNPSLPMVAGADGVWTAHSDGLPEGDLAFSLYAKPKISFFDPLLAFFSSYAGAMLFFFILCPIAVIVAVVLIVRYFVRRHRRRDSK